MDLGGDRLKEQSQGSRAIRRPRKICGSAGQKLSHNQSQLRLGPERLEAGQSKQTSGCAQGIPAPDKGCT